MPAPKSQSPSIVGFLLPMSGLFTGLRAGADPSSFARATQSFGLVVAAAKRLRRASPLNGERRSLRKISEELAVLGFLNERGKPYNPRAIKAMLE